MSAPQKDTEPFVVLIRSTSLQLFVNILHFLTVYMGTTQADPYSLEGRGGCTCIVKENILQHKDCKDEDGGS